VSEIDVIEAIPVPHVVPDDNGDSDWRCDWCRDHDFESCECIFTIANDFVLAKTVAYITSLQVGNKIAIYGASRDDPESETYDGYSYDNIEKCLKEMDDINLLYMEQP
jgi:hypothetical protein